MNPESEKSFDLPSRTRRTAAFLIDHALFTFLMVSVVFLGMGPGYLDEEDFSKMILIMLAVMLPGFFVYFAKDSLGISLGRWVMAIMVRDAKYPNEIPSFGRLLVRNLFLIVWPVELIVLAISQEKKRIGDKVAHTIVIKNPNKPSKLRRALALVGIGVVFFTFAFLFVITTLKSSEAYKLAVNEIAHNTEIRNETGGIKGYGIMPSGSVNISNGEGQARFKIKVLGNEKDLTVSVYLTKKRDGAWELIELTNERKP